MNIATLELIGVAGVVILVLFEILKWVKAHPTSPVAEKIESKVPANVAAALGIPPAITGDHAVALVTATGNAVATTAQAVAQAVAPATAASAPAPQASPPLQAAPPASAQAANPFMAYGDTPEHAAAIAAQTAQAAADAAARGGDGPIDTDATFVPPIGGPRYKRPMLNKGDSVTTPRPFAMKVMAYRNGLTEGLDRGQVKAKLWGVDGGPTAGIVIPLEGSTTVVPVAGDYMITMTADPGNSAAPNGGAIGSVQFWESAA